MVVKYWCGVSGAASRQFIDEVLLAIGATASSDALALDSRFVGKDLRIVRVSLA